MTQPPLGDDDDAVSRAHAPIHRFLDDAAHQLRSPMAGIQACAEALLRGPAPAERDRLLANVVRETTRGGRILASLLLLARLGQDEALNLSPCDLVALCADEADRIWSLAPRLDIVLRANRPPDGLLLLDAAVVSEILANLLDNARRHAANAIQVLVDTGPESVLIRVIDDGPGLGEDMVERAFEPFVSLDAMGGPGLGLSVARALARAHGGDLTYEEGGFVVRLPLVEVPRDLPE